MSTEASGFAVDLLGQERGLRSQELREGRETKLCARGHARQSDLADVNAQCHGLSA